MLEMAIDREEGMGGIWQRHGMEEHLLQASFAATVVWATRRIQPPSNWAIVSYQH